VAELDTAHMAKLRWRCRRGTTELDRLLNRFLDDDNAGYACLDAAGREVFDQLLSIEDDRLIDWLLKGEPAGEPSLDEISRRIRAASGL
jgi:antitoxin CptB